MKGKDNKNKNRILTGTSCARTWIGSIFPFLRAEMRETQLPPSASLQRHHLVLQHLMVVMMAMVVMVRETSDEDEDGHDEVGKMGKEGTDAATGPWPRRCPEPA